MRRVALLDTTAAGSITSMGRYRDQLQSALRTYGRDEVDVTVEYLGCPAETLERTPRRLRMWRRHFEIWRSAKQLRRHHYDIVHVLDGSFGYVAGAVRAPHVVVTVHDLIPRLQANNVFPDAPPVKSGAKWLINRCLRSIAEADIACAVSENTANDLAMFGCKPRRGVEVVPNAIEPELFAGPRLSPSDAGIEGPYIFHLGNNGFYKNRRGVIEVFHLLSQRHDVRLVLAGPRPDDALTDLSRSYNLDGRIDYVVNPNQETLSKLYRAASVFLFPSRYEGFGWPPLEAMSAGCPVVVSSAGSLPEVVGDAGVVAHCDDFEELARACGQLLTDETFRDHLVSLGRDRLERFSCRQLASRMIDVYRKLVP